MPRVLIHAEVAASSVADLCSLPDANWPLCSSPIILERTPHRGVCALTQFADSIGLPTDEGLFGFKPFSEVWVGRLAMIGFLTSVVQEFLTGVLSPAQ